jgi:nitroreductase
VLASAPVEVTEGDVVRSVMARQRACRSYRPDPLDDDLVLSLLESATRAPSAQNLQPWEFVVVTDPERRAAIWELAARAWVAFGSARSAPVLSPAMHADVDRGITQGFVGAPVSVVVGADLTRCERATLGSSVFPAVQNLLVAATAHGLGSALTTISAVYGEELGALVGFPERVEAVAVVPLGHPATALGPSRRDPVTDHVHREVHGATW